MSGKSTKEGVVIVIVSLAELSLNGVFLDLHASANDPSSRPTFYFLGELHYSN